VEMAPVEVTPVGGVPPSSPWARSPREIDETYAMLAVQLQQIAERPSWTVEQLTPGEHYALGVRAAALWTMGRLALARPPGLSWPSHEQGIWPAWSAILPASATRPAMAFCWVAAFARQPFVVDLAVVTS